MKYLKAVFPVLIIISVLSDRAFAEREGCYLKSDPIKPGQVACSENTTLNTKDPSTGLKIKAICKCGKWRLHEQETQGGLCSKVMQTKFTRTYWASSIWEEKLDNKDWLCCSVWESKIETWESKSAACTGKLTGSIFGCYETTASIGAMETDFYDSGEEYPVAWHEVIANKRLLACQGQQIAQVQQGQQQRQQQQQQQG